MKNKLSYLLRIVTACMLPAALLASCSVDDKYDMSKDVDMTVGVGKGLSIPVGSTEKIKFTELIDPEESDVIEVDELGYYSVEKSGNFAPESFRIDDVDITIDPVSETSTYDFELVDLSAMDDLPVWVQEEMKKGLYPHVLREDDIDNVTDFKIEQSVPEEMKKLRRMTFKKPVKMTLELDVYSETHESDDILSKADRLHLYSNEAKGFVIEVPEYIVFDPEDNITDSKIVVDGYLKYNAATQKMVLKREYTITGLDFSMLPEGYLPVENGKIVLDEVLHARGAVESDTVMFTFNNVSHAQHIDIEPVIFFDNMEIATAEGIFDPVIDPIKEVVELDLGDDLDFLNDAYLDFNDPRIFVTFNNPVAANIFADAEFKGYDKAGNMIEGSDVATNLTFAPDVTTNFYINRYDKSVEGYSTVVIPELNNLIKKIPETIRVNVNARMDNENYTTVTLGKDLKIEGDYRVSVPMVFDDFSLEYVEEIDDVLGDEAEDITDYVTDVNSVTVTFDAYNTVPATFVPSVVAYDRNGNVLNNITAVVTGSVAKGNGMVNDVVSEPVKSSVSVNLSVKNGELASLYKLDLKFTGSGSGVFNSNEYLQVKDIVITIDENISVDLN